MIRTKPNKLGLAALLTVGVSGVANAQLSVSLPSVSWNDPVAAAAGSNANNVVYTASATSNFFLSGAVTQTGGSAARVNTNTGTSSLGFRMRNSAYPNAWADFTILTGTYVANTASISTGARAMTGTLISAAITSGSTFSFEAFASVTTGAVSGVAEATGSVNFNLGSVSFTSTTRDTFTFTGPLSPPPSASTTVGSNSFTATSSAEYVVTGPTLLNSANYQSIVSGTFFSEVRITAYNSSFPTLSMNWRPWASGGSTSGIAVGTPITYSGIGGVATGSLLGSVIPLGSGWTFVIDEALDDAPLAAPDTTVNSISFSLTGIAVPNAYDSGTLAGPLDAGGLPNDSSNANVTLPAVGTSFIMGNTFGFQGTATRILASSLASELRVRIRNSAYPSSWTTELVPTTGTFASGTISVSSFGLVSPSPFTSTPYTNRPENSLRGLNIPAGSTFSVEFYDIVDNGPGADAQWSNVRLRMSSGPAAGSGAPPSATDLGVISDAYATDATALVSTIAEFTAGQVSWFKFTVPSGANGDLGRYINIWTAGANDTASALYDASGRLLIFGDDSGPASNSLHTIGAPTTAPWPVTSSDEGMTGKDAVGLPAGDYYLAVVRWSGANVYADGFVVTSPLTTAVTTSTEVRLITNVPAVANQVVTLPLNFQGAVDPFAIDRTMRYSVMQGTTTVVSSTNFTANAASQSVAITIPASVTGAVTIEVDGSQYLKRKIAANLSGSNQTLSSEVVKPGDVDNNGEVDLTDIDLIIGDYLGTGGTTEGTITDLDNNGEVDLTDIDIAIGNYLLGDDN